MTTLIILCVLIVGGVLMCEYGGDGSGFIGVMLVIVFSVLLIPHLIQWGLTSYEFEVFKAEREAFESSLSEARANGSEYETAAITREVAQWNVELAKQKYNNSTFFLDQYVDDRIETLEPIK